MTYTLRDKGVTPSKKFIALKGKSGTRRKNKTVLSPFVSRRDMYFSNRGYFEISFFVWSLNIYRANRKASVDPMVLPIIATSVPIHTPNIDPVMRVKGEPGNPNGADID